MTSQGVGCKQVGTSGGRVGQVLAAESTRAVRRPERITAVSVAKWKRAVRLAGKYC